MNNHLRFEEITKSYKGLKEIKELYFASFPKEERMPFWYIVRKTAFDMVDFLAVCDGDDIVGMSYIMKKDDLVYIQYLAINGKHHSKGYGSRTLDGLKERYSGCRIILEIEEMNSLSENFDQRLRRKAFYEKNGFKEAGIILDEFGNKYEFFNFNGEFTIKEYHELVKKFRGAFIYFFTKPKVYFK